MKLSIVVFLGLVACAAAYSGVAQYWPTGDCTGAATESRPIMMDTCLAASGKNNSAKVTCDFEADVPYFVTFYRSASLNCPAAQSQTATTLADMCYVSDSDSFKFHCYADGRVRTQYFAGNTQCASSAVTDDITKLNGECFNSRLGRSLKAVCAARTVRVRYNMGKGCPAGGNTLALHNDGCAPTGTQPTDGSFWVHCEAGQTHIKYFQNNPTCTGTPTDDITKADGECFDSSLGDRSAVAECDIKPYSVMYYYTMGKDCPKGGTFAHGMMDTCYASGTQPNDGSFKIHCYPDGRAKFQYWSASNACAGTPTDDQTKLNGFCMNSVMNDRSAFAVCNALTTKVTVDYGPSTDCSAPEGHVEGASSVCLPTGKSDLSWRVTCVPGGPLEVVQVRNIKLSPAITYAWVMANFEKVKAEILLALAFALKVPVTNILFSGARQGSVYIDVAFTGAGAYMNANTLVSALKNNNTDLATNELFQGASADGVTVDPLPTVGGGAAYGLVASFWAVLALAALAIFA